LLVLEHIYHGLISMAGPPAHDRARRPFEADSVTATRLRAMQRGHCSTAGDGSLALIVSPQRGQIRYAGSRWRRRSINQRSVAPSEVIRRHAVHVICQPPP
jgi:hypothetical protein